MTASDKLPNYMDWPGLKQVFMVERKAIIKNTVECRAETVYGITSLTAEQADASCLMKLVRCHWHIENRSHWVRDVTFDEDRSQVRSGNIPQVMAALRNTAIGLMRFARRNQYCCCMSSVCCQTKTSSGTHWRYVELKSPGYMGGYKQLMVYREAPPVLPLYRFNGLRTPKMRGSLFVRRGVERKAVRETE